MPTPRSGHCSVLMQDVIFLIGGDNDSEFTTVDAYNITQGKWRETQVLRSVPARSGHACALLEDAIFVTGGRTADEQILR